MGLTMMSLAAWTARRPVVTGVPAWPVVGSSSTPTLNLLSAAAFAVGCAAVGLLALAAPRGRGWRS
jgi:hypothetical protein